MIKLLVRGAVIVSGVAFAGAVLHTVLKADSAAAARPVTQQVMSAQPRRPRVPTQPGYHIAEALSRRSLDDMAEIPDLALASMPARPSAAAAPEASSVSSGFNWFGLLARAPEPRSSRQVRDASDGVRVVDPGSQTPSTAAAAISQGECRRQDLEIQAQGVTADVEFVGVLLTGAERAGSAFTGAELGDLKIQVQWQNLFSTHRQRVDLIAPDGSVYRSLLRPLTASNTATPVVTIVPVSGTWITRYGLYGSWCVDVFFDDGEKPVTSRRVVIASS
jgi:hypothetical protein